MNYKGFHQLQWEDRLVIEKMLKVGDSKAKIAEALGVCKKTIYNEIKRGWTQQMTSDYEFIWCYCPEMAERKYQENLRAKGPDLKIGNDIDFANYVEQKIVEEHYSPAALLAELKAKPPQFDTTVCEATLYNYIYRGECSWSSTRSTCTKRAAATMVRNTVNNGTPPELPKAPALISVTPSSTPALLLATGRWTA